MDILQHRLIVWILRSIHANAWMSVQDFRSNSMRNWRWEERRYILNLQTDFILEHHMLINLLNWYGIGLWTVDFQKYFIHLIALRVPTIQVNSFGKMNWALCAFTCTLYGADSGTGLSSCKFRLTEYGRMWFIKLIWSGQLMAHYHSLVHSWLISVLISFRGGERNVVPLSGTLLWRQYGIINWNLDWLRILVWLQCDLGCLVWNGIETSDKTFKREEEGECKLVLMTRTSQRLVRAQSVNHYRCIVDLLNSNTVSIFRDPLRVTVLLIIHR